MLVEVEAGNFNRTLNELEDNELRLVNYDKIKYVILREEYARVEFYDGTYLNITRESYDKLKVFGVARWVVPLSSGDV